MAGTLTTAKPKPAAGYAAMERHGSLLPWTF